MVAAAHGFSGYASTSWSRRCRATGSRRAARVGHDAADVLLTLMVDVFVPGACGVPAATASHSLTRALASACGARHAASICRFPPRSPPSSIEERSAEEQAWLETPRAGRRPGSYRAVLDAPPSLAYGLALLAVCLAAWVIEKWRALERLRTARRSLVHARRAPHERHDLLAHWQHRLVRAVTTVSHRTRPPVALRGAIECRRGSRLFPKE